MIPVSRPDIGPMEQSAVLKVLATGMLVQGAQVEAFEREFSDWVGSRHCVAVNSGTSALLLCLLSHGIGPGDEVIVPSFTFAATANAVRLAGAEVIFADIDAATYCLDPSAAEACFTERSAAVIPVHLFGHPADMSRICEFAARKGLVVIEDAAQAHGAADRGRPVGAIGDTAAFSFYPTKNMTTGEGGMVVTADPAIAARARTLRNQGMSSASVPESVGFNLRMTETAAAMGSVQLRRLPGFIQRRKEIALMLNEGLAGCPGLRLPTVREGAEHSFNQYTVRSSNRERLKRDLHAAGVASRIYYSPPVHQMRHFMTASDDLPETLAAACEVLSLPMGPHLDNTEVRSVVSAVVSAEP